MQKEGVLHQLLRILCPKITMHIVEFITTITNWATSVNHGIEFSPVIACWIFIVAALNCCFPNFLPSYFNWKSLSSYLRLGARLISIWMLYYIIWVPANRALYWALREYLILSKGMCQQWMPFLSVVMSIYILALSLSYSGLMRLTSRGNTRSIGFTTPKREAGLQLTSNRSGRSSSFSALSESRGLPRSMLRMTRSGTIYGTWGDL